MRLTPVGRRSSIPFYRNVKTVAVLLQLLFAAAVFFGMFVIYNNVSTAINRANLPSDFSFLGARAGIPIGETPIAYDANNTYARALQVGIVNTLRVALVGVVLATLLGIGVGLMRLSTNWLLRQIATVYVEVLRNTPLLVQIVFWFSAILLPLPPRQLNAINLPGGGYFNNSGLALPWPVPSYNFAAWLPWLVAALLLFMGIYLVYKRHLVRLDRPGSAWTPALFVAFIVAAVGYLVVAAGSSLPANIAVDFRIDRGRGTVFIDEGQTGRADRTDPQVPHAAVRISVEEGSLQAFTGDFTESRRVVRSTFRFPPLREHEFAEATVTFADPELAQDLSIHFDNFPSTGRVYRDRNGNGFLDPGEEFNPEASGEGFVSVEMILTVTGFERTVVADRNGQISIPRFLRADDDDTSTDILPLGPLVMSFPTIPTADFFGGTVLSTSYLALLLGLAIYTSAFIAEIVRGGIQAVAKGQSEAAKSLGLNSQLTFRLVVFPQALRVIIPPLISQYLNLTKNSSLGFFIGYQDFFSISQVVGNQTGAFVPVVIMVIVVYSTISLLFSFVLNIVNARLALVER